MDLSEVTKFDQQQVGKLKLSAAIRIGAKLRPKCTGVLFDGFGSCALGAALEASGVKITKGMTHAALRDVFPELWSKADDDVNALCWKIIKRNDRNKGNSRESIADWLEAQGL